MGRPTRQQQNIIKVRNNAIKQLVLKEGHSQSEVGRIFNLHRAIINQVIKEIQSPKRVGDNLLKNYIFDEIKKAEDFPDDSDYAKIFGLDWRAGRGSFKDYLMNEELGENACSLWDEYRGDIKFVNGYHPSTEEEFKMVEDDECKPTRVEDIVITHKGAVKYVIRFNELFDEGEYPNIRKISIPTQIILSLANLEDLDLTDYIV